MKKIIALLLALTLAMGLVACGIKTETPETTTGAILDTPMNPDEGDIDIPLDDVAPSAANGATTVLSNIWSKVPEENKFFAMGGDMNNMVDNNAGAYSLEDEGLTSTLLIPEAEIANVDEAASLVHGMMLNNFTAGMFHVTGDAAAFAEAMHTAITANQWMCGMPEKLVIAIIDGEYVLACFGINDAINPFETALTAAYPNAEVKYSEAITG